MSSSAKSMPASISAIRPTSSAFTGATALANAPPICRAATLACSSVTEPIRSLTASAWVRSMRPARNARWVNSPGSASRAPPAQHCRTRYSSSTGAPCAAISTTSSPVYEFGAANSVTTASSNTRSSVSCSASPALVLLFVVPQRSAVVFAPPDKSRSSPKRAHPAASGWRSCTSGATISRACGPESRTTPIPPRPAGVEIATIVSCSISPITLG